MGCFQEHTLFYYAGVVSLVRVVFFSGIFSQMSMDIKMHVICALDLGYCAQ